MCWSDIIKNVARGGCWGDLIALFDLHFTCPNTVCRRRSRDNTISVVRSTGLTWLVTLYPWHQSHIRLGITPSTGGLQAEHCADADNPLGMFPKPRVIGQLSMFLDSDWTQGFWLTQDSEITKPQPRPETERRHHRRQTWMIRRDLGHSQRVTVYGINLQHVRCRCWTRTVYCILAYQGVFFPGSDET